MKTLNVAVIGVGNMGSAHVTCIGDGKINGMRLYAVCDLKQDILDSVKERYNCVTYKDWHDVVNDGSIDAVIIAVPHPLHADMAIALMENNKHVLCEKPIDIRVSKALKLNSVADRCNVSFAVMFNQRTNNIFAKAREIVKSGELGKLKRSVWIITNWYRTQAYYDSGSWRATWAGEGGGVLLNQAPHNLDLWQWICGMPESITAYCDVAKYHNIEVEDDVTILARYKNGATGAFITSTGELPGTNRLEISGECGKLVAENGKLRFWKLPESEREICFKNQDIFPKIETEYQEFEAVKIPAHATVLQNFADNILTGTPLIAPGTEAINQLMLSNAAYLSAWKNCEIKLPFDEKEYDKYLDALIEKSTVRSDGAKKSEFSEGYSNRWQVKW